MTEEDGFNSKNWVWVPDGTFYTKGFITDYNADGTCKVTIPDGGSESHRVVDQSVLENCNPNKFNKCNDMAELTHLNEPSVVYNLYLRYNDDLIYTYSGLFLVAINPYKLVPIYDNKLLKKYHSNDFDKPPPHIFATAEGTYRNLLAHKKDQLILVTGESGAGKTENTKKIIQYLSSVTPPQSAPTSASAMSSPEPQQSSAFKGRPLSTSSMTSVMTYNSQSIDTKILQANPILESFGNAKTIKNNNSSRFGKFIRIFFSLRGHISGANIDYYLLEKSRVVSQSQNERNYHVFYQFLKGYDQLSLLGLSPEITNYKYLNNSSNAFDDAKEFLLLVDAFNTVGFAQEEVKSIFQVLAVVLHLGNLDFTSQKSEQASFTKDSPVDTIVELLGIDKLKFVNSLVRPKVKAGRELVQKSMKAPEVKHSVDAFAKHLYERLFQYLIERINENLKTDGMNDEDLNFIGVLDIAGFEIFDVNSFEQLCINYTNEKLQQFFNHHSFILEQSEYLREDIQWEFIDFGQDLQPTIDLIELRNPMGILKLLHEECVIPKSSDRSFMEKLSANFGKGKSPKFQENKLKSGFIIHHYAGKVEYNVENWLQKNTDPVSEHVLALLPDSLNQFIVDLFTPKIEDTPANPGKRTQRLKSASLKHKEQLGKLMEQLESTEPHFVRCILPNLHKKANKFDKTLVLHQLRCNGVLEGIRITRAGYPNRMTFEDFYTRYAIINTKEVFTKNTKTNAELLLKFINLDSESFKIGITKIFFKNGVLGKLEEMRDLSLKGIFTDLQSVLRGKAARRLMEKKIKEIQSSQLLARTMQKVDESIKSSLWMDLFINIKPLLEESVKVLDNKEMNENLKNVSLKLKDAEKTKTNLEADNTKLRENIMKLEEQVTSTTALIKERESDIKKLEEEKNTINANIKELESKGEKLSSLNAALTKLLQEAETKSKDISSQLQDKGLEHDTLKDKHSEIQDKLTKMEEELRKLTLEKEAHLSSIDKLQKEHLTASEALKEEIEKLKSLKATLEKDVEKFKSYEPRNESLSKEIAELKASIASHVANTTLKERELNSLRTNFKRHEDNNADLEKSLNDTQMKLREISSQMDKKSKEIAEVKANAAKLKAEADELRKELAKLKTLEKDMKTSKTQEKKHLDEITSLTTALAAANAEKKTMTDSMSSLKREYESLKRDNRLQIEKMSKEIKSYSEEKERLRNDHTARIEKLKKESADREEVLNKRGKDKLAEMELQLLESKTHSKLKEQELKAALDKISAHDLKVAELNKEIATYTRQLEDMSNEVTHLKLSTRDQKEQEKENYPPDPSFVEDFANIKLKLNEQNAALRKEKFENKKMHEELTLLKERAASNGTSFRSSENNRRSINLTTPSILNAEVDNLRKKLQIEEANAQRAENYAIELQKKLNKVQATRGVNSFTDYEKKYRESQARITELENRFEDFFLNDSTASKSLLHSESFSRNSIIQKTLAGANNDFVVIYQDISRTLRTTRDELGAAKSEILRLKSLLRESEDELYDAKRQTFRTSISDYEEELALAKVKYDAISSKNADLTQSLELFKKRAEEYYGKLELAESAVNLSKKLEESANKQLEEAKSNLRMAREEARTSQILVKDLRKKTVELEEIIQDKSYAIKKLEGQIEDLNEKTKYYTSNYDNREVNEGLKKEIRELHLDLNDKMKNETDLIKENKKLQLDLEDLTREKKALDREYEDKLLHEEELEVQVEDLTAKSTQLENDRILNERKILLLSKQVDSLKEVMEEITNQRDDLLATKDKLEEELFRINLKYDDTAAQLERSQADLALMREHLANQREESSLIKSELNQSKLSSSNDVQDYQKLRKSILVTEEENDSLKRVNRELTSKVHTLEEKLYNDEQLKYWESKVKNLESELDSAHADSHQNSKVIKNLERQIRDLTARVDSEAKLSKKFNNENFEYQNKFNLLQSRLEQQEKESEKSRMRISMFERENTDLQQENMLMEKEILELRERLGLGI